MDNCKKRLIDRLGELPASHKKIKITSGGTEITVNLNPLDDPSANSKEVCILKKGLAFFDRRENFDKIKAVLDDSGNSATTVSLRVLDYLVTNYSRRNGVTYTHNGQFISLFALYKSALRAYSKRSFDAFCRRERILLKLKHTAPILTTHAQINFFLWCCRYGVLEYALAHKAEIEREMGTKPKARSAPPAAVKISIAATA